MANLDKKPELSVINTKSQKSMVALINTMVTYLRRQKNILKDEKNGYRSGAMNTRRYMIDYDQALRKFMTSQYKKDIQEFFSHTKYTMDNFSKMRDNTIETQNNDVHPMIIGTELFVIKTDEDVLFSIQLTALKRLLAYILYNKEYNITYELLSFLLNTGWYTFDSSEEAPTGTHLFATHKSLYNPQYLIKLLPYFAQSKFATNKSIQALTTVKNIFNKIYGTTNGTTNTKIEKLENKEGLHTSSDFIYQYLLEFMLPTLNRTFQYKLQTLYTVVAQLKKIYDEREQSKTQRFQIKYDATKQFQKDYHDTVATLVTPHFTRDPTKGRSGIFPKTSILGSIMKYPLRYANKGTLSYSDKYDKIMRILSYFISKEYKDDALYEMPVSYFNLHLRVALNYRSNKIVEPVLEEIFKKYTMFNAPDATVLDYNVSVTTPNTSITRGYHSHLVGHGRRTYKKKGIRRSTRRSY